MLKILELVRQRRNVVPTLVLLGASASLFSGASGAQQANCPPAAEIDKSQLLRRLSLDLRDRAPTFEEYAAIENETSVPDSVVDAYLASNDFGEVARNYHELLWLPNLTAARLTGIHKVLSRRANEGEVADATTPFDSVGRRLLYRSKLGTRSRCGNFRQTINAKGQPVNANGQVLAGELDGYVMVHPYWDPTPATYGGRRRQNRCLQF
jgi:hypothetical protein